jgi:ribose transport system substrate-binding protein
MHKTSGLTALATAAMLALTACGGGEGGSGDSEGGDKGALAMSFAGRDIQLWNDMLPFMEQVVEDAGYEFVTDNPEWDAQTQVEDWESWIVQGEVKTIMGYPAQSESMIPVTAQAQDAGIPVLGYGSEWEGVVAAVLMDHERDGEVLGEAAAEWIRETYGDEQVDVALLAYPDTDLGRLRGEGIKAALAESGVNVNITEHTTLTADDGYAAVQNQLQSFPDTKVWLAISNDPARGAYQSLMDAGVSPTDESVLLGNVDGTDAELTYAMEEGSIWRLLYMVPAREIAEANARMMIDAAEGEDLKNVVLEQTLVTPENGESFLLENQ